MKRLDSKKTVFLLDGSSFLYRAYHGMRPLHTSTGEPVHAVYSFIRMIKKLIKKFSPEHMVLVWDAPGKTTRHEMFADYKATRQAPPNDLFEQKEDICEFAKLIGLAQIEIPGIEADDIMFSLARDAKKQGYASVVISSDKDMRQVIDEHTYVYDSFKDVIYDEALFEETTGFPVKKLPFYFALLGDSSDNIPGVRGIGKKGAFELVISFDSLDQLYDNLNRVKKPRMQGALERSREDAFLSRSLFLLQYHDVGVPFESMMFDASKWDNAFPLFKKLEFSSLVREISPQKKYAKPGQTSFFAAADQKEVEEAHVAAEKIDRTFSLVTTKEELDHVLEVLGKKRVFALDTETTGVRPLVDRLVGISIATDADAWYIPFGHEVEESQLEKAEVFAGLKPIFEHVDYKKYLHHARFDSAVLWNEGISLSGIVFDTMLAAKLVVTSEQKVSLKALSKLYLGQTMLSYQEVVKDQGFKNFSHVPLELATQYAAADAWQTFRLQDVLHQELKKTSLLELYQTIEQPLQNVLIGMEREGIMLDADMLASLGTTVTNELMTIEKKIAQLVDGGAEAINLNSPKQVQQLLFDRLQLPPQKKSKKGGYSTDSEVLRALEPMHPVPGMIAKYRELAKLKNTYIDALPRYIYPKTAKIHTSFSQTAVATGRLASSEPNLQNIPADQGHGVQIRAAFKPREGELFVSADYSQIELRVMAHVAQDERLKNAFAQGVDVHAQTASGLFECPVDQITHEQRQIGKRINFSVLYGMTPYGLSKDLGIAFKDAKKYIDGYFEQYPQVRVWMDRVIEQAKERGYVSTMSGRRRYVPGIYESNMPLYQEAVRVAVNTVVQGTAADIMKIGMIKLSEAFAQNGYQAAILLQIHDELLISVKKEEKDRIEQVVRRVLEHVVDWEVSLHVTTRSGPDWKSVTK